MKRVVFLIVVAACGEPSMMTMPDAPSIDARSTPDYATLVQTTSPPPFTGMTATIPIAPTREGDLVVVGVGMSGGFNGIVHGITTSMGQHFSRDTITPDLECERAVEIWSFPGIPAGVDAVTVEVDIPRTFKVDVIEVSGLSPYPLSRSQNYFSTTEVPTAMVIPAEVPSAAGNLVVSQVVACGTLTGLDPGSPFTAFDMLDGTQLAFFIPAADGSHGARWIFDGPAWEQATIAYR